MSRDTSATCSRCQQVHYRADGLEWTGCGHWVCKKCVEQVVNVNLSLRNEVPRCQVDDCHHKLDPVHFHSITRNMLQALDLKYSGHRLKMGNIEEHVHASLLFQGFVRESWPSEAGLLPGDVMGIIFDYFKFTYYVSFNRSRFERDQGNNQVSGDQRSVVVRSAQPGVDEATRLCDALTFEMILDFQSLRRKQVLCVKCNKYHPQDMIVRWTDCHHAFCGDCIINHFLESSTSIWTDMVPRCPLSDCHCELSMHTYEQTGFLEEAHRNEVPLRTKMRDLMYSKYGGGFYCAHCRHWHGDQDAVRWSCGHRYGKWCALQMLTEVIPTCSYGYFSSPWYNCVPRCEAIVGVTEKDGAIQPQYCCAPLREQDARTFGTCDHRPNSYQLQKLQELWIQRSNALSRR